MILPPFHNGLSEKYILRARRKHQPYRIDFYNYMKSQAVRSEQENVSIMTSRIRSLLEYCSRYVPYYRDFFKETGAEPGDFGSLEQFSKFPALTRQTLLDNRETLKSDLQTYRVFKNSTGGSTGEPVTFYQDQVYLLRSLASIDFASSLCGYLPGKKQLFLWGSERDVAQNIDWKKRVKNYIGNSLWINTFGISRSRLYYLAEKISKWRPDVIFAYTSSARLLAEAFEKKKIRPLPNPAVQLTAETVTALDREYIAKNLGAEVFNRYGSREVSIVAHECKAHRGLHIFTPTNYLELGEQEKDTGYFPIIVTNLTNRTMPLLRYEIGDLALPATGEPCPCGLGFPRIAHVTGRISDLIRTPSGDLFHGEYFTHLFYGIEVVRRFQVEQTSLSDLSIRIEMSEPGYSEEITSYLERKIHAEVDASIRLNFEFRDTINPSESGKFRYTISRLPRDPGMVLTGVEQK